MKYEKSHLNRKNLANCLNRLKTIENEKVLEDDEFLFFHKHRNFFNNKYFKNLNKSLGAKTLELCLHKNGTFKDNLNRVWKELTYGNAYHHPYGKEKRKYRGLSDYPAHIADLWFNSPKERFSRKFVSRDEFSIECGYEEGCEFELIIHRSGRRLVSNTFMETYNFGPSTLFSSIGSGLHNKFDIEPHEKFGCSYYDTSYYKSSIVMIKD